jgi:hypothetical protein
MIGPNSGPKAKIAIATPLCSTTIMSVIDPPPMLNGAAPAHPARKRNATNVPMFIDSPHIMVNIKNKTLQTKYTIRRPYNSKRGAINLYCHGTRHVSLKI